MQQLLAGYSRFRSKVFAQHSRQFAQLARCHEPEALFITCSDSRVMPEMITQCSPGLLLCCRNPGNLVPPPEETSSGVAGAARRRPIARPAFSPFLAGICGTDVSRIPRGDAGPASVAGGGSLARPNGA